jgi:hypothetical protein
MEKKKKEERMGEIEIGETGETRREGRGREKERERKGERKKKK